MKMKKYEEAKKRLKFAFECCNKVHGTTNEECILILNNLSVACVNVIKLLYLIKVTYDLF